MNVILLGTGSPVPMASRTGTSLTIASGDERLLLDCGPGTVRRLLEQGISPGSIDHLFFTHHHIDHNADFYNFAINNWVRGGGGLRIHGPNPWTETLLQSMYDVYEEDIAYRDYVGYSSDPIWDLEVDPIDGDSVVETDRFRVSACSVDHSIETYAYRTVESGTGRSMVFSGDTRKIDELSTFAEGADVLVQDSCIAPPSGTPPDGEGYVWDQYTRPLPREMEERLRETHCDPAEAGEIAAEAGVGTLVLTHLLPYRDEEAMHELAAERFDGDVLVASDGMTLDV